MTSESVPVLSAEEEDELRRYRDPDDDTVPRLLATLDAERAASAARIAELETALRFVAEYVAPDGERCWCHDAPHPDTDPYHWPYCRRARAAIKEAHRG